MLGAFYLLGEAGSLPYVHLSLKKNKKGELPYYYNFFLQHNQVSVGVSLNQAEVVLVLSPRMSDSSRGRQGYAEAPHWVQEEQQSLRSGSNRVH